MNLDKSESAALVDLLETKKAFSYPFKGVSMLPMLRQGKDMCTFKPKGDQRLQKYDVAL